MDIFINEQLFVTFSVFFVTLQLNYKSTTYLYCNCWIWIWVSQHNMWGKSSLSSLSSKSHILFLTLVHKIKRRKKQLHSLVIGEANGLYIPTHYTHNTDPAHNHTLRDTLSHTSKFLFCVCMMNGSLHILRRSPWEKKRSVWIFRQ